MGVVTSLLLHSYTPISTYALLMKSPPLRRNIFLNFHHQRNFTESQKGDFARATRTANRLNIYQNNYQIWSSEINYQNESSEFWLKWCWWPQIVILYPNLSVADCRQNIKIVNSIFRLQHHCTCRCAKIWNSKPNVKNADGIFKILKNLRFHVQENVWHLSKEKSSILIKKTIAKYFHILPIK